MEAIWKDVARRTKDFIKHPDRFLENENNETFDKSKLLLKVLYDGTKIATDEVDGAAEKFHKNVLPELLIEDFDEEQVWTAVELQNKSTLDECQNAISNLLLIQGCTYIVCSCSSNDSGCSSGCFLRVLLKCILF